MYMVALSSPALRAHGGRADYGYWCLLQDRGMNSDRGHLYWRDSNLCMNARKLRNWRILAGAPVRQIRHSITGFVHRALLAETAAHSVRSNGEEICVVAYKYTSNKLQLKSFNVFINIMISTP